MRITGTTANWQSFGSGGHARTSLWERKAAELLALAGVTVNGHQPWDPQIHDPRFYRRLLTEGTLGAGEAYMEGWWDADSLDALFTKLEKARLYKHLGGVATFLSGLKGRLRNMQTKVRSQRVADWHYNLGNDLYQAMLGRHMQYSCAYWRTAKTLNQAQESKLHLICRKLGLKPGMRLLDVGGGFGSLARFAAKEYGSDVVAYNISREQVAYARELCKGLPVRVEQKDYRDAANEPQPFDRIVSVGFFEHVGHKNYRGFLRLIRGALKDGGLFLLHTIGGNEPRASTDPWIDKYIFANGTIPSTTQITNAAEGLWVVEDWHNFGPDYDRTLGAWWRNFERAWPDLRQRYDDRFYRMWRYYLMSSAGAFRARTLQLWQVVLSKGDFPAYKSVR